MVEPGVSHGSPASHDTKDFSELKEEELLQAGRPALDGIVWRKLDIRLLPLCTSFFLLDAVDRTSIANARVAGLQTSLGMSNYQFAVAITVTLYIVSQLPTTLLLKHVGPDFMLPTLTALWGVVTISQGLVTNYSGLLACRFFLGFVQGGLPPCIVLYLSFFYPRKQMQIRIASFFASASLASAFSGLLAAAIEQLDGLGGKPGWAWIFIIEGLFTFVFGVITFFLVPRSPETTRFLTEGERAYVVSTLKHAGAVSDDDSKDSFRWTEIVKAAKSPHVWLLAVVTFFSVLGLAYFEPTIVAGLGYTGTQVQLMSVPPFAVTFVLSFISSFVSDRYHCRGYTVIFFSLMEVIGFTMFYASTSNRIRYASLFFSVTGAYCAVPALQTWIANNSSPHTRRATALGVTFTMAELGGILSTWLLGSLSAGPDYTAAAITFIAMSVCMVILATVNLAYLRRENRLKAEMRQKMTKDEEPWGLGDRSAWFIYSL
ncbi:major facilitator superfamily domain-containing protein [Boletus coccyginus]|nr:major facilitator superfamily domain-containing protein [Boletus coccyginus]